MKPTVHLRWVRKPVIVEHGPTWVKESVQPVLQQWWQDECGNGEWRDVALS